MMDFTQEELHIIRQWFDNVQDTNDNYLKDYDYELAKKIYNKVGMRIPNSINDRTDKQNDKDTNYS